MGILLNVSEGIGLVILFLPIIFLLLLFQSSNRYVLGGRILIAGLLFSAVINLFSVSPEITVGTSCQGNVSKKYEFAVMVNVSTCGSKIVRNTHFYVPCVGYSCPKLYSSVTVTVSDAQKFGRFSARAKVDTSKSIQEGNTSVYYQVLKKGHDFSVQYFFWLSSKLPKEHSALITSMLFGEVSLPNTLKIAMKDLGILHLIAISGVNITYLLMLLRTVTAKFKRKTRTLAELCVLVLLFIVVGEAVSLVRAMLTFLVELMLRTCGGRSTKWHFMVGIAVLLLLEPGYLYDAGYWLVSSACFGVYIGGASIDEKLVIPLGAKTLLKSMVIWLCVVPAQLLLFGQVQPIGILVGLVLAPLVEIVTVIGYVGAIVRFLPVFNRVFLLFLGLLSSLILLVINLFHDFISRG